ARLVAHQDGAAAKRRRVAQRLADVALSTDASGRAGPLAEHLSAEVLGQALDVERFEPRQRGGGVAMVGPPGLPQRVLGLFALDLHLGLRDPVQERSDLSVYWVFLPKGSQQRPRFLD